MKYPPDKLVANGRIALERALLAARRAKKPDAGPNDLLHALAFTPQGMARYALEKVGWEASDDEQKYALVDEDVDLSRSPFLVAMAAIAYQEVITLEGDIGSFINSEHLLLALVRTYPQLFTDPQALRREVLRVLRPM
jgi:hypothetical protein